MRLFVAVWPDDSTVERLSSLELHPARGLRPVGSGNWHITLRFLGEVGDALVPALSDALRAAAACMPGSLRCELGPSTAWFGGERVLQIPARGLDDLAASVRSATISLVPARSDEPPFNAHLTIASSKRERPDVSARAALAGVPLAAGFEVGSFDLVSSQHSTGGRLYTTLARVSLPG
ncbi:MAG TPA: RNA 2',3'-cyclic phosphodiesterase [Acidimicrobiales bacterium]|nr:RNA 2',3'-cyclic phosphodiesterase [Acidimicrobiales bacterium]